MEINVYFGCEDCKYLSHCANVGYGCCNHLLYRPIDEKKDEKEKIPEYFYITKDGKIKVKEDDE